MSTSAATKKPHIAILGAGPTGLEAALAADELSLPFTVYEAGEEVGSYVRAWGHVRLFSPWSLDVSPRARAALLAAGHTLPGEDDARCPTGAELLDRVLAPIAGLPAIAPGIRTGVRVVAVGREGLVKSDEIGTGERSAHPFRLLLQECSGREWTEKADAVIDCTGTYGHPNSTGDGGIPAPGERPAGASIARTIPDFGAEAAAWAGRRILLVGAGHSAQTAVADLADLAAANPGTRVVWILRSEQPSWAVDPDDPLPSRAALTARARALAEGSSDAIETRFGVAVDSLVKRAGGLEVALRHVRGERSSLEVDRVLSLTGGVGDHTLYRQLQVHECYATSGPMKLAAALLGSSSADCLAQESPGAETLVNPEPGFFILGSKSYGRNSRFLMRLGWQQVDEVLGLLAGV